MFQNPVLLVYQPNLGATMNSAVGNPMGQTSQECKECPSCHTKNSVSAKFCPECGFNFNSLVCSCGNKLAPGVKFCPECGKRVE